MAPSLEHYEEATCGIPVKVLGTQIDGTNGAATLQLEEADKHDQVLRVFRCSRICLEPGFICSLSRYNPTVHQGIATNHGRRGRR